MPEKQPAAPRWRQLEPYWYLIALFLLGSGLLYIYHLATGNTPDRVAFTLGFIDFNIYWYGIIITAGIALGAYVVSRLAHKEAELVLDRSVPAEKQGLSLETLELPPEIDRILEKRGVSTLGDLLLRWGFGADVALGLNEAGQAIVRERIIADAGVDERLLDAPPWSRWNPNHVWNGLIWCLIFAVIGARLYHVLTPSPSMAQVGIESPLDYLRNPLYLINVRRGGLGIYGGLAGGALGLLIYAYRARIPVLAWADLGVVGLALGQFVGRWGNFVNQELYGAPTDLPWAVYIDPADRLPGYVEYTRFHPAFLYESLWNFLAFLLLYTLWRRYRRQRLPGDLMAAYLILYGLGRILLETVRLDSREITLAAGLQLPVATAVSLSIIVIMAIWILVRHRQTAAQTQ